MLCAPIQNWHYYRYFPKMPIPYSQRHNAQNYIDEILRPHVEPHTDYHALANTVSMQEGVTPIQLCYSQEFLTSTTDVLLWPVKSPDSDTTESAWSVVLRRINGINPLSRNSAKLRAAWILTGRTSHRHA